MEAVVMRNGLRRLTGARVGVRASTTRAGLAYARQRGTTASPSSSPLLKPSSRPPTLESEKPICFPFLERGRALPSSLDTAPYGGGCLVLVDKPQGWTSFDVCNKLRNRFNRSYGVKKVGHTGTLDPMATGLLLLCVGRATKMVPTFTGANKRYEAVMRLGEGTASQDADTDVTEVTSWRHITRGSLRRESQAMLGEINQVPPMYSAIKVGGKKLYELARDGKEVERKARPVIIHEFELFTSDGGAASALGADDDLRSEDQLQTPDVRFTVGCSKGTYVRTLAFDLGRAVGSVAHLTALRRTQVGEFSVDDAWDVHELTDALTEIAADAPKRKSSSRGS